jgi:hypothetical protein
LEALKAGLENPPSELYKVFQVNLYEIYKQFSDHELTLIAAIDKISLRIDRFIQAQNDKQKQDELKLWKRGLFGKQNELAIVNGGLKPTLEEIADLVNLSSRTYQVFEKEFKAYKQKRQEEVANELQNFILVLDSSIRIIINSSTNDFLSEEGILKSSEYSKIWVADSTLPKIGISLSKVNTIIENHLNKQGNLKDFKEGFCEQGQELLGSKIFRCKEILPIAILVSPVIVTWLAVFHFRGLFITPKGGIGFVVLLIVLFLLFLRVYNIKPNPSKWDDRESLSNPLDVFFSSASDIETFRKDFKENINNLKTKSDQRHLQWELSRLGQSFRQYYRALVLNNADVDLPFVPSSVKQSVASLVRRTKTKIDQAGNEVDQLREEVEIWFDRSMDRSSGVYKRNARGIAILIGFLLAAITNSDSTYIVNRLASDQELRQAVVQGAERFIAPENQASSSASPTSLTEDQLRDRNQILSQLLNEQLALPIGWNARVLGRQLGCELSENARDEYWQKLFDKCISPERNEDGAIKDPFDDIYIKEARNYTKAQEQYQKYRIDPEKMNKPKVYFFPTAVLAMILTSGKWYVGLVFLVGWFVTAIAISMGATFWFELLGKLVNVRNTGNRPPSSANHTSVNSEKSS